MKLRFSGSFNAATGRGFGRKVRFVPCEAQGEQRYRLAGYLGLFSEWEGGAAAFGWSKRKPEPRSMRDGQELIGWGVSTGMWDAFLQKAEASAKLTADGRLEVSTAASDIGTGTWTIDPNRRGRFRNCVRSPFGTPDVLPSISFS